MTTCPLSPVQEELCAQLQIQLHVRTLVLGLARKVQELAELKKKTKTRVLAAAIVYLGCQLEAALDETFIDLATLLAVTRLDLDNLCPVPGCMLNWLRCTSSCYHQGTLHHPLPPPSFYNLEVEKFNMFSCKRIRNAFETNAKNAKRSKYLSLIHI
eukprot:TRINITY_DN4786_c0_g1_i1.p1 TRINITY_DN4786_c0_g1~~TRINITY_DN4786_c0_g1_i1.p1  ORF type:complete len:156 (-),score=29.23 TRINITY_DN4786_c0_g1_i1:157-624(-)